MIYLFWVTKTVVVRILVIILISHIIQKVSARAFHGCS